MSSGRPPKKKVELPLEEEAERDHQGQLKDKPFKRAAAGGSRKNFKDLRDTKERHLLQAEKNHLQYL